MGFNWRFDPLLVIFLEIRKLHVLDQVHFKKIYNDWISQHLYFFFIFEKNYNDWIKSFSKSKWTGLLIACTLVTEGCITFLMLRTVSFYDKIFVSAKKYQILTQWPLLTSATLKFAQHFFSEATSNQSIYCDN